ncbi:MAG: hypothetical protein ABUS51_08370 [Acidobacteriota bacterium]
MPLITPVEFPGTDFDRIQYRPLCHGTGIIEAVWVSLTRIVLEGRCAQCEKRSVHTVDLLETDAMLNETPSGE